MEFSSYQLGVFDFLAKGKGHGGVNAVAGSGKTFTTCEATRRIPRAYSILLTAFGKDIAAVLKTKNLSNNVTIATYNAWCWGIAKKHSVSDKLIFDDDKNKGTLQHAILQTHPNDEAGWKRYMRLQGPIDRLIRLLKAQCTFTEAEIEPALDQLILDHGIEVPQEEKDFVQILKATYMRVINNKLIYDYDDQIFQPLYQEMPIPAHDFVFVDEDRKSVV